MGNQLIKFNTKIIKTKIMKTKGKNFSKIIWNFFPLNEGSKSLF